MVKIESKDGRVNIEVSDGSSLKNVRIGGEEFALPRTKAEARMDLWTARIVFIAVCIVAVTMLGVMARACSTAAHASPLDCEAIVGTDQRHYCRAMARGDRTECELIKDSNMRAQCRALLPPKTPKKR